MVEELGPGRRLWGQNHPHPSFITVGMVLAKSLPGGRKEARAACLES